MIPSILVWNCRGANSTHFFVNIRELVSVYKPNILVIVETRVHCKRVWPNLEKLLFVGLIVVEEVGFSGGIWVAWDFSIVDMDVLSANEHNITMALNGGQYVDWIFSAIYASPRRQVRDKLLKYLGDLGQIICSPWLVAGDMN